ncbi:glucosidase II beta subunit-like protein-domain-containing protein, partial [Lineolata rhizophorae]
MKHFWVLSALINLALGGQHAFSVLDDVLAFPQYEVVFSDSYISEASAESLLAFASSTAPRPQSTPDGAVNDANDAAGKDSSSTTGYGDSDAPGAAPGASDAYQTMRLHGQRYLCTIPAVTAAGGPNQTSEAGETAAVDEQERELARASDRGWELLRGMEGNCIYFRAGWWSYSFCYGRQVKQFHALPPGRNVPSYPPTEDPTVHSFVLGTYGGGDRRSGAGTRKRLDGGPGRGEGEGTAEADGSTPGAEVARLETRGESRYLVQKLVGGTVCDLTGKERKIEVQFHCHPQSADHIGFVKEVATCSYLMVIYTPRLCNDVAFLPPQKNKPNPITCQEIVAEEHVSDWLEAKSREAEDLLREMAEMTGQERPVVGGVEVGAQFDVGSEGRVLEKSVIVGGGKEVELGTIASSDGRVMAEKDLRRLEITNMKEIDALKKILQKKAGDKPWKLVLVETPRGKEFRGIIEPDE